ncbi:hypothetical protein BH11PLA2_BH11PLA2_12510 [soil metagenome]
MFGNPSTISTGTSNFSAIRCQDQPQTRYAAAFRATISIAVGSSSPVGT